MKWFHNLRISVKLIITFVLVAILSGVVGYIGIKNIRNIDHKYSNQFINYGASQGDIGKLGILFHDTRNTVRDIMLDKNSNREKYLNEIKENDKKIDSFLVK
ncbi:MCP four helix bundle domain-containing protein [Clostridium tetanomorphum]|nr:MCP four helix bundle domain-containing protein [Clostridium tetanomorphum]SQC00973.1 methyl-accepting chemotaxis protein [Clostridium tetanomorphum]